MNNWAFYISVFATVISAVSLSTIAYREHDRTQPRTLSELVAAQDHLLHRFRNILFLCGTLFAVPMYGYIIPHSAYSVWLFVAWTMGYIGNLLAGFVPARGATQRFHELCAQLMAAGMIGLGYLFWLGLSGSYATIELGFAIGMSVCAVGTIVDRPRFLYYELPFLYLSHLSIVVAAYALWHA